MAKKEENKKQLSVQDWAKTINKNTKGHNPIVMASDIESKERLSTGIPEIDKLIGGGWVCGGFNEVYGIESSAKSTLMFHTIRSAQEKGYNVFFINLEKKMDVDRLDSLGIDRAKMPVAEDFQYAEEVMELIMSAHSSNLFKLIVIDSITSMSPELENVTKKGKEIGMNQDQMALLARQLSKFFRRSVAGNAKSKTCTLIVSQGRTAGIGGFATYTDTTGGNAKKHYGSLRLEMRQGQKSNAPTIKQKIEVEEDDEELNDDGDIVVSKKKKSKTESIPIGFESVITVKKDHAFGCAHIGTSLHLPFYFDTGFIPPKAVSENDESMYLPKVADVIETETDDKELQLNVEPNEKPKKKRGRPSKKAK